MVKNRSAFLSGLKTRLDRDVAGRERADAAVAPRWSGAPAIAEDDLWGPAPGERFVGPEDPISGHEAVASPRRDDRAASLTPGADPALSGEQDQRGPATPWSENGMPERLRDAIASVRRISSDGWPAVDERPPEQLASWQIPEDDPPAPETVAGRPGFRVAGFALTSAVVLLVGFGVGALLAGWDLGLPLPVATTAPPPAGPVARETDPSAPPAALQAAPPAITEIVKVQPAPMPPAPSIERPPSDPAIGGLPLPPPPKPAPWSTVASAGPSAAGPVDDAVDAAVDALVEEGDALVEEGGGPPLPPAAEATTSVPEPRVYVHFAASAAGGPAIAMHLVRRLNEVGFAAEARPVDFPILSPSIRYFFAADRDSAEALKSTLEGQIPGGAAPPVLDFTHYEPKPRPGNLEIWVDS